MEKKDSLVEVLQTLFKWKRQLFFTCLAAGIGSIIISLLLPVYYKSTTVFLAASPDQAKPELLFGKGTLRTQYYGNENDIDRILTLAQSNEVVEFLIDSFNLFEHYDIDPTHPKAKYKVKQAFFDLYEIKKTKRDAIELSIEDRKKEMAARIVNAARERLNEIAQGLIKERQFKAINTFETSMVVKEKQLTALSDSLIKLRSRYGIYNSGAQTESLTAQFSEAEAKLVRNRGRLNALKEISTIPKDTIIMAAALVAGLEEEVNSLKEKIKMLNDGMAHVNIIDKQYQEANQTLSEDKERNKRFIATYNSTIPAIFLVEQGAVPIIKSRPKRSIIVLAAVAIAFLFSIFAILLIDSYKHINWREIINAK